MLTIFLAVIISVSLSVPIAMYLIRHKVIDAQFKYDEMTRQLGKGPVRRDPLTMRVVECEKKMKKLRAILHARTAKCTCNGKTRPSTEAQGEAEDT